MAAPRNNGLHDGEICNYLEESDIEFDNYEDHGEYDEYLPDQQQAQLSDSSSSSETSDAEEVPIQVARSSRPTRRDHGNSRNSNRGRRGRGANRSERRNVSIPVNSEEWKNIQFEPPFPHLSAPSYIPIDTSDFTQLQYFEQYIDDQFIALIVDKSNQTSVLKNGKTLQLTVAECKVFIGITMTMSCIGYPYLRMYWETNWRVPIIADSMSRNRFFLLRSAIKFVYDPDITPQERAADKVWKVRPLIDKILHGCRKQVKDQHVSIDEMIVPFSGNCGIKQYCPNKPNPVGLKIFVLANPSGIVCDFIVYQGSTTFPEENAAGFGLGESAILYLTRSMVPGHIIYFDRYFTTIKLVGALNIKGLKCAGTIMKNRLPATLRDALPSDLRMKRNGRGTHSVLVKDDYSMAVTKWYENKPVLLLSSLYGNDPEDQVRRWCKSTKSYINVKRPVVVKMYNNNMGGVDLADRMLAVCPARHRTRKWTIRFFSHMLDLAVSNSWIQFRIQELNKNISLNKIDSLRPWKMKLAQNLIETNLFQNSSETSDNDERTEQSQENTSCKRGRPGITPVPSKIRRLHKAQHMPVFLGVPSRCRQEGCNKRTTAKCTTCNIALCLTAKRNCYSNFHS